MSDRISTAAIMSIKIPLEDLLPPSLCDLVEVVGLPATLKLVEHYPGVKLFVPTKFDPTHILVRFIGHDETEALIKNYGGEHIEIAKAEGAIKAIRNAEICSSDKSQRELALEYGLTVRQIRNIQNGVEVDDGQAELF